MSARIIIQIDLDDAAYEWERFGEIDPDNLEPDPEQSWDTEPINILKDAVKYASGWRMNVGRLPGSVSYQGQLIEINGARATSITWEKKEE